MGSDDEIEPGGVGKVLSALAEEPDLSGMTLNRHNVDDDDPELAHADDPRVVPPPDRVSYQDAESIFAELAMLQDYISTQVVRRDLWLRAVAELGPDGVARGLNFPHMPILGAVIEARPRWRWIAAPLIRHRIGEKSVTSTFDGGLTAYTIMVTDDRERIWRAMFGRGTRLYRLALRNIWRVQAHPAALGHIRRQPGQPLRLKLGLVRSMLRAYWFLPEFWLQSVPILVVPHRLMDAALGVARRIKGRPPL